MRESGCWARNEEIARIGGIAKIAKTCVHNPALHLFRPLTIDNAFIEWHDMKRTLDKAGRIVLPKQLRDELCLNPGDALEIESTGTHISLRPVRNQPWLHKKRGVWVYGIGEPLSAAVVDRTLRQSYQVRASRTKRLRTP